MPENEEEIADNLLRVVAEAVGTSADDLDFENSLAGDLGLDRKKLQELAFAINKDDYFKPLGVGLIPDDVADCETLEELVVLVESELNNELPQRRNKDKDRKPKR